MKKKLKITLLTIAIAYTSVTLIAGLFWFWFGAHLNFFGEQCGGILVYMSFCDSNCAVYRKELESGIGIYWLGIIVDIPDLRSRYIYEMREHILKEHFYVCTWMLLEALLNRLKGNTGD